MKLATFVRRRLVEGWSPQRISGWLRPGNEQGLGTVAMETIHGFIRRAAQKTEEPWRYPARRRKKRRPPRGRPARDIIRDRVSIHDRPGEAATRSEAGHWEGDLIICQRTRPVLVPHERETRVTLAARLTGKGAAETASVIMAIFRRPDPDPRRSVTFGNGGEFARHGWPRDALNMATCFRDARASWRKGGIENASGRLGRWLPRQANPDVISDEDIREIVMTCSLTPRKCPGYRTPLQALFSERGRDVGLTFA